MSSSLPFNSVGVLGCGLMGSGIAQVSAVAGYRTVVRDLEPPLLARGQEAIRRSLAKLVEKGKLKAEHRERAEARLEFTTELERVASSDLVIEAVTENLATKNDLWSALDSMAPPTTLFATNTSSLKVADMAAVTRRPDRFLGLHFFNPVPLMPLVEVVRSDLTSDATVEAAIRFVRSLGKEPVIARDQAGFIVNLLLVPFLLDAVRAAERGVASVPDIDLGIKLGCGHPMGPLTLLDLIGLDTTARIAEIMYSEYQDNRYRPPGLLRAMVSANRLGRKSGVGFYDYRQDPPAPVPLPAAESGS